MTDSLKIKRAEQRLIKSAMRGYRKALRNFPWVFRNPKEEFWRACQALAKARKNERAR